MFSYYWRIVLVPELSQSMLVQEAAVAEFAIMALVCFLRTAQFGDKLLFSTARIRALDDDLEVIVPSPEALRTLLSRRGLLHILCDSSTDLVNGLLALARSAEIDWSALEAVGWFSFDFPAEKIVHASKWKLVSAKRNRGGYKVPTGADPEIPFTYVSEFRDNGMRREFAEAVINRDKKTGVGLTYQPFFGQPGKAFAGVNSRGECFRWGGGF